MPKNLIAASATLALAINTSAVACDKLSVVYVNDSNRHILENLSQPYEAEFSPMTEAMPNKDGTYSVYLYEDEPYYNAYLLYSEDTPIGFTIKGTINGAHDIAEFYVTPRCRKLGAGNFLAHSIFNKYPGKWQIRQLLNATNATAFWQKTISNYDVDFTVRVADDEEWGQVVMQEFQS